MSELSQLHPAAQVACVIATAIIALGFFWFMVNLTK